MKIRCPKLGDEVDFSYCKKENYGLPCPRTIICWSPYFDVEAILKKEFTKEEWEKIFETPPKPKIVSLLELIEEAKKSTFKKKS